MKIILEVAATLLLAASCSNAFTTIPVSSSSTATRISNNNYDGQQQQQTPSLYMSAMSNEKVKSVGGGVAIVPSGNRALFDPGVEGKLGDTDDLDNRISQGWKFNYLTEKLHQRPELSLSTLGEEQQQQASPYIRKSLIDTQHWLEHLDVPTNFAKASKPVTATVLGSARLISEDAPGDIQHIVMSLPEGMHYVEGQSLSVIPPGVDSKNGKKHKPRLYSIASTRYGDLLDGKTVSLCVRRAEYYDPVTGKIDPSKKGLCSNFLCDAEPGTTVSVAGPVGKTMLLPEDPEKDVIMVATGTGIAPFRSFLHRLFMEQTLSRHMFNGKAWLILGVPVTGGLLYKPELDAMMTQNEEGDNGGELEVTYAISREMKNKNGGKMYVQDVLSERADEVFTRLENGASIYFCGLKGMMPGIMESLEKVALERGVTDWPAKLKQLQANHQWHVEVY